MNKPFYDPDYDYTAFFNRNLFQAADGSWSFFDEAGLEHGQFYPTRDLAIFNMGAYCFFLEYGKGKTQEELDIEKVSSDGYCIKNMINPSEKVQLAAVLQDGTSIRFIDNASEQIKIAAVTQNGKAIRFIDNPSEDVIIAAINQCGECISFIKNPSKKIQQIVLKQNFMNVLFMNEIDEDIKKTIDPSLLIFLPTSKS